MKHTTSNLFRAILLGTLLFVVSIFVFCPRFYFWDPVGSPTLPESYRAFYVLVQLQYSPYVKIPDIGSNVLEWRLFFPVIGHFFNIHWIPFFSLAHFSALALTVYAIWWVLQRTRSWAAGLIAGVLTCTSSAFFISTGFLGYFDAAMTLALCVCCLERRRVALWAAASIAPWIDERFIYALPLVFFCQWVQQGSWRAAARACVPVGVGVAPYLLLRVVALMLGTDHSRSFFHDLLAYNTFESYKAFVGTWDALRWGWVPALIAVLRAPGAARWFAFTAVLGSFVFLILSAGDYSRSMMIALPLVWMGVAQLWPKRDVQTTFLLTLVTVLNFVMPAYHSFRAFHIQIYPYPVQLKIAELIETLKK